MIITGTSRSIGKYLAQYYVNRGFFVIGCSRSKTDYKSEYYKHFCLDITNESEVRMMFLEVRKKYKRLDVLINNAGAISINYTLITSIDTAKNIFNTNFIGTFLFCREAVKLMRKNKQGRIINISSIAVPLCSTGMSIYSASKSAVEQFSKVLSKEVESEGITVNTLGLSIVEGSGMKGNLSEKAIEETMNQLIIKSPLELDEISHVINFFISDKSKSITKQIIYLGGV